MRVCRLLSCLMVGMCVLRWASVWEATKLRLAHARGDWKALERHSAIPTEVSYLL